MGLKIGILKFARMLLIPRDLLYCLISGVEYDTSWRFYGLPKIFTYRRRGEISIGRNFIARSTVASNSIGVFQPVIIKSKPNAKVQIGDNVGISGSTISASKSIVIGNNVLIGSGCLITDSDAHPIDPNHRHSNDPSLIAVRPIVIGDNVFIGARAIIFKGVTIGKGSVVAAGSVVVNDVSPNCIFGGNPAKMIKGIA